MPAVTEPPGELMYIEMVAVRLFPRKVQQLGHDQVGDVIADRRPEKDDSLLQEQRIDVVRALTTVGLLDDHRKRTFGGPPCQPPARKEVYDEFDVRGSKFDEMPSVASNVKRPTLPGAWHRM